ncbi:MAG: hypothetical protein ACRDSS_00380 [Actinocrinis sp.]
MAIVREGRVLTNFKRELDPDTRFSPQEYAARLKDFGELEALRAEYQRAKAAPATARGSKTAESSAATDDPASGTTRALMTEQESQ